LDAITAEIAKLGQESAHASGADVVSTRMRDDRLAARRMDPAHGLCQRRPLMRRVAGLASSEVMLEHVLDVARVAFLHQEPGKMSAGDQMFIRYVLHRTFIGATDSYRCERIGHLLGSGDASGTDRR